MTEHFANMSGKYLALDYRVMQYDSRMFKYTVYYTTRLNLCMTTLLLPLLYLLSHFTFSLLIHCPLLLSLSLSLPLSQRGCVCASLPGVTSQRLLLQALITPTITRPSQPCMWGEGGGGVELVDLNFTRISPPPSLLPPNCWLTVPKLQPPRYASRHNL
jgi:hypothetical protein